METKRESNVTFQNPPDIAGLERSDRVYTLGVSRSMRMLLNWIGLVGLWVPTHCETVVTKPGRDRW